VEIWRAVEEEKYFCCWLKREVVRSEVSSGDVCNKGGIHSCIVQHGMARDGYIEETGV
jgi:hypothetical protein